MSEPAERITVAEFEAARDAFLRRNGLTWGELVDKMRRRDYTTAERVGYLAYKPLPPRGHSMPGP